MGYRPEEAEVQKLMELLTSLCLVFSSVKRECLGFSSL